MYNKIIDFLMYMRDVPFRKNTNTPFYKTKNYLFEVEKHSKWNSIECTITTSMSLSYRKNSEPEVVYQLKDAPKEVKDELEEALINGDVRYIL